MTIRARGGVWVRKNTKQILSNNLLKGIHRWKKGGAEIGKAEPICLEDGVRRRVSCARRCLKHPWVSRGSEIKVKGNRCKKRGSNLRGVPVSTLVKRRTRGIGKKYCTT